MPYRHRLKLSRQRPPDAFLRIHVPERFVRAVYPEPSVPDGKRVARQSDTPFDVVFQDMHLDLVPAVGMREVEDQHVAPLCFPEIPVCGVSRSVPAAASR